MRIPLDWYGSTMLKVRRWRPTVSNETIVATKQQLPCTIGILFFMIVYISDNAIFECSYLFFGWEINHPRPSIKYTSIKYVHYWGNEGSIQNEYRCAQGDGR